MTDPRGKFKPNWKGPYLVKKLFSRGAAILSDLEGNEFKEPINLDKLKKYFMYMSCWIENLVRGGLGKSHIKEEREKKIVSWKT